MSDTMISDKTSSRVRNRVPGRLKSIVINEWLTVSYAGLSDQAMDAIRGLRLLAPLETNDVVSRLKNVSMGVNGEIDFLVCSHENASAPRLIRISGAQVSEGSDKYWIGDPGSANAFSHFDLPPMQGEAAGEFHSLEEQRFTRRFHEFLRASDPGVGGMVINCLASPFGHCYQDHLGVYVDEIRIPDPVEPSLRQRMHAAGMNGYFRYAVLTDARRGQALVGVYFEQAGVGFIHEPLIRDDPDKIDAASQAEFQAVLQRRALSQIATAKS